MRTTIRDGLSESRLHTLHRKLEQVLDDSVVEGLVRGPAANKSPRVPRLACASKRGPRRSSRRLTLCPHDTHKESRLGATTVATATRVGRGEVLMAASR